MQGSCTICWKEVGLPDISMCENKLCPLKDNCYRYTAKPSDYQLYAGFAPDDKGKCDYFWDNEPKKQRAVPNKLKH